MTTTDQGTGQGCGCPDFRSSRRTFLRGLTATAGATVLSGLVGDVFTQASFAAETGGNVLVVLSLRGGSDGLSLVVPHGDPAYATLRPRIAIPASQLLVPDPLFGLHPGFAPLEQMWNEGRFGAVQAVGTPLPDRSHFSAMEKVEDADPGSSARIGWINRMVGLTGAGEPNDAVQLGTSIVPTALVGPGSTIAVRRLQDIALPGWDAAQRGLTRASLQTMWARDNGPMGAAMRSTLATTDRLAGVAEGDDAPQHGADYPTNSYLAAALRQTARLIRADVGTQVVTLDHGSWDMHTDLGTVDDGLLQQMVRDMARSLAAFFADLGPLGERVTVVTISEFGRTSAENGDYGTDHGYANAMLLLGGGVKGGQVKVRGEWPGLSGAGTVDGDLNITCDYRSVLAEVLTKRFPTASIPAVFPGLRPEAVGIMS